MSIYCGNGYRCCLQPLKMGRPVKYSDDEVFARLRLGIRGKCHPTLKFHRIKKNESANPSISSDESEPEDSTITQHDVESARRHFRKHQVAGTSPWGYSEHALEAVGKHKKARCHDCNGYLSKHQGYAFHADPLLFAFPPFLLSVHAV